MRYLIIYTLIMVILLSSCYSNVVELSEGSSFNQINTIDSTNQNEYNFDEFNNVEITNFDFNATNDELSLLYTQAKYCQAMTEADIDTLLSLVSDDKTYTHLSGMTQTKEEYFNDIKEGNLVYYNIGISSPKINIDGNIGLIEYTSILEANAYGSRGTFRINGTHYFERKNGNWISINNPR